MRFELCSVPRSRLSKPRLLNLTTQSIAMFFKPFACMTLASLCFKGKTAKFAQLTQLSWGSNLGVAQIVIDVSD